MNDLTSKNLGEIVVGIINEISMYFLTFITALSVVVFIWGVVKYIYKGDSEGERKKGRELMFWGIIGLFVLFGIWGILEILANTFGIEFNVPPQFDEGSIPIPFRGPPRP